MVNLKPGRELDALVAETVMGWKSKREQRIGYSQHDDQFIYYTKTRCPPYSTKISAAWEVVEKLRLSVRAFGKDKWVCEKKDGDSQWEMGSKFVSQSTTAPHAICLSALEAVGVNAQEV